MIPFEELAASGIDRATAERLNYRCTPDGGWEIPYLDPQGQPYTYGYGVPSCDGNSSRGLIRNTSRQEARAIARIFRRCSRRDTSRGSSL